MNPRTLGIIAGISAGLVGTVVVWRALQARSGQGGASLQAVGEPTIS